MAPTFLLQWVFLGCCAMFCFFPMAMGLGEDESGSTVGALHTIVTTECTKSFSFQSLALAFSHKKVKQPGRITRIMTCSPRQLRAMSMEDLDRIPTHVIPDMTSGSGGNEAASLNQANGIWHWLKNTQPQEEWVLIVDAGVIFREPIDPAVFNIPQGWARAARFTFHEDLRNGLADKHVPALPILNDTFGGTEGRKVDETGMFYLLRRSDLHKSISLYMKYTEALQKDPAVAELSRSVLTKEGREAHLAEAYGWSLAMSNLGIRQVVDPALQVYPNHPVRDVPKLTHYGVLPRVEGLAVNNQHPLFFDAESCPPWNLDKDRGPKDYRGLFPHPLYPSDIPKRSGESAARYAQLLAMESVNIINEALCERHRAKCPESWELSRECVKVHDIASMLEAEFARYRNDICHDSDHLHCAQLARDDGCSRKWPLMSVKCRSTCEFCFSMLQPKEAKDDTSLEMETVDNSTTTEQGQADSNTTTDQEQIETVVSLSILLDPVENKVTQADNETDIMSLWSANASAVDPLALDNMSVVEFQRKCRALSLEELRKNRDCAKWIITEGLELAEDHESSAGVVRTQIGVLEYETSKWMFQLPLIGSLVFVFVWMAYVCRWTTR